jgi:membrane protein implicated in regulation of membrane protease activity
MDSVQNLYFTHPFWVWMGIAAVLLALELPTATGWLLWPSACAGLMALFKLTGVVLGWPGDVALYAVLTIVATVVSRRFMPKRAHDEPDINDRTLALLGKQGLAVGAFDKGSGRVLVDGAEWDADIEAGEAPSAGGKVEVVRVHGGSRLTVRTV